MAGKSYEEDVIPTSGGELTITFIGHATLMFAYGGKVIHVDPTSREADYGRAGPAKMPKADMVLVTHGHGDHLDPAAIAPIRKPGAPVVLPPCCADKVPDPTIMANGGSETVAGLPIEAVPAYNIVNKRPDGSSFHPRGQDNGYVITFGDRRVYVAGDTENTPEMKALKDIDVAFLPMNLPYTMSPQMVADAAKAFRPKVLYPYHYGETDTSELVKLLAEETDIEVRVRRMK